MTLTFFLISHYNNNNNKSTENNYHFAALNVKQEQNIFKKNILT